MSEEEVIEEGTTEEQARERGWVPKEEWSGDEGDWVPAKEYLERGKLYDAISSANNKIKNLEKANENLTKHYEGIKKGLKEQHEKEIRELKAQLESAAEEGDKKRVAELNDEIVKQSTKMEQDYAQNDSAAELDSYHKEWLEENPWYGVDEEKTQYAKLIATGLLNQYADPETQELSISVEEIYRKIDKEVEARFGSSDSPDNEGEEERPGMKNKRTAVSTKSKRGSGVKKNKYDMMSPEQKQMCDSLVRQGVMSKEDYIKDLEEAGYLGESA